MLAMSRSPPQLLVMYISASGSSFPHQSIEIVQFLRKIFIEFLNLGQYFLHFLFGSFQADGGSAYEGLHLRA
eukprot:m.104541 g.104541  ORF g.104541 m.104541 type:complete len:72 (+) comp15081_c0_seq2:337-552(+)